MSDKKDIIKIADKFLFVSLPEDKTFDIYNEYNELVESIDLRIVAQNANGPFQSEMNHYAKDVFQLFDECHYLDVRDGLHILSLRGRGAKLLGHENYQKVFQTSTTETSINLFLRMSSIWIT